MAQVQMVTLGDSILEGYDGHEDVARDRTIPATIGKILGWQVNNLAIGGTKYDMSSRGFYAMTTKYNFYGYDVCLIGYGVNDYSYPNSLEQERNCVIQGLNNLKRANPHMKILIELPTQDFRYGKTSLDEKNDKGWTQNDLDNMLISVARDQGVDYYDWRPDPLITPANHTTTLGDGQVHPTQATMDKMAQRLADKLRSMNVGLTTPTVQPTQPTQPTTPTHPTTPTQPTTPYQPTQPTQPAVKSIDNLKIDRLPDLFGIGTNVEMGMQRVADKANELYKSLARIEGLIDVPKISVDRHNPGNALERPLRSYVVLSFMEITSPINDLVHRFNKYWLRDPDQPIDILELSRPDQLTLDKHYLDTINQNWSLIEGKINELVKHMNKTLKGGD